jgi:hypothetical protein
MSPARATILWDVLVPHVGQKVSSIDVAPNPLLWQVLNWIDWLYYETVGHFNLWHFMRRGSDRARMVDANTTQKFFFSRGSYSNQRSANEISHINY